VCGMHSLRHWRAFSRARAPRSPAHHAIPLPEHSQTYSLQTGLLLSHEPSACPRFAKVAHSPPGSMRIFTQSHLDQALQLRDFPLLPDLVKAGACGLRAPSITKGNASHEDRIVRLCCCFHFEAAMTYLMPDDHTKPWRQEQNPITRSWVPRDLGR
jgi:hypothetical protein